MKRPPAPRGWARAFGPVRTAGLAMPEVVAATKYDGSPVLKVRGCFIAGLALHPSAEPGTLVVRVDLDEREWMLSDAPDVFYLTDYYRRHPVVLVRLSRMDAGALRDLLSSSRRLALLKAGPLRRPKEAHSQTIAGRRSAR